MSKSMARISKQEIREDGGEARLITTFIDGGAVITVKNGRGAKWIPLTDDQLLDLKWALATHLNH